MWVQRKCLWRLNNALWITLDDSSCLGLNVSVSLISHLTALSLLNDSKHLLAALPVDGRSIGRADPPEMEDFLILMLFSKMIIPHETEELIYVAKLVQPHEGWLVEVDKALPLRVGLTVIIGRGYAEGIEVLPSSGKIKVGVHGTCCPEVKCGGKRSGKVVLYK